MSSEALETKLVGEIVALRMAVQSVASYLALASGEGNDAMSLMHDVAAGALKSMRLDLPGFDETTVRAHAEQMLDDVFTNSKVARLND